MLKKSVLTCVATVLAAGLVPSTVCGYGAAHVGYTHVGPNGVYHAGETVARGPEGDYAGRTTDYRAGGVDRVGYGGAAGGYHYSAGYAGGAAYGGAHYAYVR